MGSMSEGILEVAGEMRIVYANPRALSILGLPEEDVLASNLMELFGESDQKRVRALIEDPTAPSNLIREDAPLNLDGKKVTVKVDTLQKEEANTVIIIHLD